MYNNCGNMNQNMNGCMMNQNMCGNMNQHMNENMCGNMNQNMNGCMMNQSKSCTEVMYGCKSSHMMN